MTNDATRTGPDGAARPSPDTGGYFDAATVVPPHPVTALAFDAALADGWADPTRLYTRARRARQLLDAAREVVAEVVGVAPPEVYFCPSGTNAAEQGVLGVARARLRAGDAIVHSAVEHSAVLRAARWHADGGGRAVEVGVDSYGVLDMDAFTTAIRARGVAVAAVMAANHEVGTVQPVPAAARVCADAGVPLHTDAACALGRIEVPAGWSTLSASARKWGGPAGVGVLVVRDGTRWTPPFPAEETEFEASLGALNLPAVVAAAASLRAVVSEMDAEATRLRALTARIRAQVPARVPDVVVVGHPDRRLPHVVTFSCLYVDGEALTHALAAQGFAVSSGSACTASSLRPSHVLGAMGVLSHGNVRISLHRDVGDSDVERFLEVLPGVVSRLRAEAGVSDL